MENRWTRYNLRRSSLLLLWSDHTYKESYSPRAALLRTVGGQHKNYPIINNIHEQRVQATLMGPSLRPLHLKATCPRLFPKCSRSWKQFFERATRHTPKKQSWTSFAFSCRESVVICCVRATLRRCKGLCGLLSLKQESTASVMNFFSIENKQSEYP